MWAICCLETARANAYKVCAYVFYAQLVLLFMVFWSSQNGSFVFDQIFVYGTLMGVDYKSEKKI